MQAIILAAGMGKRLKELTSKNTKCMVEVNGETIIERMLRQIDRHHFSRVVIVVGYEREKLTEYIETLCITTPIEFITNDIFEKTNNIYSLFLAKDWLCMEDTVLFESDIIFEESVLDELLSDSRDTLVLVDKYEQWMSGTCVKLSKDDSITEFVPGKKIDYSDTDNYYKTVNIYKFSKEFSNTIYVPFLTAYRSALGENEYYEQVLRVIAMLDEPMIKAKRLHSQKWYEIDDKQDLDIAKSMFNDNEKEVTEQLLRRYGGFWRYPHMIDFCYLINPFFPPKRMIEEMKANYEELLVSYPSGMNVNCLLASLIFEVEQQNIVVGNGAAEIISCLMQLLKGRIGLIRPSFEEYSHRYDEEQEVCFVPDNPDYSYSVDDLICFYSENVVKNIVLINPDNPSGNYIRKEKVLILIEWCKKQGINLILDESFVDFSDEKDSTMISQSIISANPHLFVIKSISKSYGVPGLRLGVVVSGNKEIIDLLKKRVPIWNINSFAEFFLQKYDRYHSDYDLSLTLLRDERKNLENRLNSIEGVRVVPSQANYFMVEIEEKTDVDDIQNRLLVDYGILVKSLKTKTNGKNYLRVAIRNQEDNNRLVCSLREIMTKESAVCQGSCQ